MVVPTPTLPAVVAKVVVPEMLKVVPVALVKKRLVEEERVKAKRLVVVTLLAKRLVEETKVVAKRLVPVAEVKRRLSMVELVKVELGAVSN